MDRPSGIIVSMGMRGCVVGSSDVVGVSGSWEVLCFFVSCGSSLGSCCWSSRFRLFVGCCSSGSFSACDRSQGVVSSKNGVGDWGGELSLVVELSGVFSDLCFFASFESLC